jgi:hypothetical protein
MQAEAHLPPDQTINFTGLTMSQFLQARQRDTPRRYPKEVPKGGTLRRFPGRYAKEVLKEGSTLRRHPKEVSQGGIPRRHPNEVPKNDNLFRNTLNRDTKV